MSLGAIRMARTPGAGRGCFGLRPRRGMTTRMTLLRVLALLLLADVAAAQITTPPPCRGATIDREVFQTPHGRIKFHLRFHDGAGTYDAHAVVKLHRRSPDASCNDGAVFDTVIDELVKERQFLPPP
jgi:hypothetical protein